MSDKTRLAPMERFFGYYPGTVSVITVQAADGERNVMSAGWHTALSMQPPLYGVTIGEERYTYHLVKQAGAFAIGFLPFEHAELVAAVGSTSRNDGFDKFARFGIEVEEPLVTSAPILKAAYLTYECTLYDIYTAGDHDLFVGEIVAVHYDAEGYDERLLFNPHRHEATVYLGRGEYLALGHASPRAIFPPERFREG